jgi:unsaturated chondroitin disaccharide hydrolase
MAGSAAARLLEVARRSVERTHALVGEAFPHVTEGGRWKTLSGLDRPRWEAGAWRHGNWTGGFWVGCLWLALRATGDPRYGTWARQAVGRLAGREADDTTHDLGFLFYPSHVLGDALQNDEALRDRALVAAQRVAARFVPGGGYIQAWGPRGHAEWMGTSTIDTMMNLPLLWWAARHAGQGRAFEVARAHAATTRRHFFRADGSTYHLLRYDPTTGAPERKTTFQGHGDESCWARGQSWAIAGFAIAYRETGDREDLAAAEAAAAHFLRRLPADGVPYWDFDDPTIPEAPRDSSAGAIAAHGLLELAAAHPDAAARERHRAAAARLLGALEARCENADPDAADGLLLHGCYSRPHGEGVDGALIWGDYFYLHARLWLAWGRRPEDGGAP